MASALQSRDLVYSSVPWRLAPSSRFCWIQLVALHLQELGGEIRFGAGEQLGPAQADHRAATARPLQPPGVDAMAASDARGKAGKGFLGRRLRSGNLKCRLVLPRLTGWIADLTLEPPDEGTHHFHFDILNSFSQRGYEHELTRRDNSVASLRIVIDGPDGRGTDRL